ncbi:MAG: PEGA domain protein [Candidatus Woesebacteria bacterium GW2011_GWB1_45_5]|uniref:PEGA domain protein n=1 Tax=Candidatus Woesebacteria bacterium GW2011_GWB1_45_5 TaxID=1618581 RepID=A0A0G1MRF5_9BACT|nr:MAG: PEGA domain protein [Candidatus Woesebacteria bacterium GW2011_GWB1_45_5]
MRWVKAGLIAFFTGIFVIAAIFFLTVYLKPKPAGLFIDTNPSSSVYINGSLVGKTPYKGTLEAGGVTVKLVPELGENLLPFETKITLVGGIQTVIGREFAASEEESSGSIISFEKEGGKETSLIVISTPENAQVSVDGVPRGFAPYKTSTISPAEHQITVRAPEYADRIMTLKTVAGYRLTVFAKLAKIKQAEPEVQEPEPKTYIEILPTPTGYLRVRSEPGGAGREIDQVEPGNKYLFLEEDAETGWYKIQLESPTAGLPDGRSGWVSNQYSKKVKEVSEPDDANTAV